MNAALEHINEHLPAKKINAEMHCCGLGQVERPDQTLLRDAGSSAYAGSKFDEATRLRHRIFSWCLPSPCGKVSQWKKRKANTHQKPIGENDGHFHEGGRFSPALARQPRGDAHHDDWEDFQSDDRAHNYETEMDKNATAFDYSRLNSERSTHSLDRSPKLRSRLCAWSLVQVCASGCYYCEF